MEIENILNAKNGEKTFFLVDDDEDDRYFFLSALKKTNRNSSCIIAKDGEEALEYLEKNESFIPDFIFLDLNMPRVTGKECLVKIRQIERLKDVPICIYSTSSAENDKTETIKLGADDYMIKPNSLNELTEMLSKIILTGELINKLKNFMF
ncbi:MAG TPA: response regulator [Bacteroidia bacterium]|nr:response regulator [Bacteroidia bacterium]